MQPLEFLKKSCNLWGQKENYATSQVQTISRNLSVKKKSRNLLGQKKSCNRLGKKKSRHLLGQKK